MTLKSRILDAITHPALDHVLRPLRNGLGTILMLHRFGRDDTHAGLTSVSMLRRQLEYLRMRGYVFVSLSSLVSELTAGRTPPRNAVAFTVDDGYADFRDLAAPVFAEFDCPVTVFATTGPIDRTMWFWWDRVQYAFVHAPVRRLDIAVGTGSVSYSWKSPAEGRAAAADYTERMKLVPEKERLEGIERLCASLHVDTSGPAPAEYEAMTWADLRRLTGTGLIDVGPHTVSHPILSRTGADQIAWEIRESWRRLREECPSAIPVFCYPNGTAADYTRQTMAEVRAAGLAAAVTTERGHVARLGGDPDQRYRLPRFPLPHDVPHLAQVVTGLERAKLAFAGKLTA